ncbi:hypothetical protein ACFCZ3_19965 [Cellulosimicrobium cellulans]|uniref:hypothetical protein n=1 Tax=Cellulosimicrobium cellulans TaxID=1710 RepID=UPI0035DAA6DB
MSAPATLARPAVAQAPPRPAGPRRTPTAPTAPADPAVAQLVFTRATAHRLTSLLERVGIVADCNDPQDGVVWHEHGGTLTTALVTVSGYDCEHTRMRVLSTTATGRTALDATLDVPTSDLTRLVHAFTAAVMEARAA